MIPEIEAEEAELQGIFFSIKSETCIVSSLQHTIHLIN